MRFPAEAVPDKRGRTFACDEPIPAMSDFRRPTLHHHPHTAVFEVHGEDSVVFYSRFRCRIGAAEWNMAGNPIDRNRGTIQPQPYIKVMNGLLHEHTARFFFDEKPWVPFR